MRTYQSFKIYISIREHFKNKKYDYFEKRGKHFLNSPQKFEQVKPHELKLYEKYAREYNDNVRNFYVANFVDNRPIRWIGDLDTDYAHNVYMDFIKFRQAPTRYFKNSVAEIVEYLNAENITFKKFLLSGSGFVLTNVHTMNILNQLTNLSSNAKRDPLYNDKFFKLEKYAKFVSINSLDEYSHILKDTLKHLKT